MILMMNQYEEQILRVDPKIGFICRGRMCGLGVLKWKLGWAAIDDIIERNKPQRIQFRMAQCFGTRPSPGGPDLTDI